MKINIEIHEAQLPYDDKVWALVLAFDSLKKDLLGHAEISRLEADATIVCICSLFIKENYRRSGVGSALIQGIINECKKRRKKKLLLSVDKRNGGAIDFYKKIGFFRDKSLEEKGTKMLIFTKAL